MSRSIVRKLNDDAPPIKITTQTGSVFTVDFSKGVKAFLYKPKKTHLITVDWLILGEYETPAQVERVIHRLKAAIERGDEEFTFPTVKELKLRYVLDRTADGQYLFNVDGTVSPIRFWYSDAQGNEISREEVRELELEFVHGYDKDDEDFLDEDDRWFNEGDRRYDEMRDM